MFRTKQLRIIPDMKFNQVMIKRKSSADTVE